MNVFDVYDFQNRIDNIIKEGELKECLELLGIVYFNGSLEEGNENRIVFEFSKSCTLAIEVQLMEKKIRFWGWIGNRLEGDYFWEYVSENYEELWRNVLSLLISKYFSPDKSISCEIVATTESDLLFQWMEGSEGTEEQ